MSVSSEIRASRPNDFCRVAGAGIAAWTRLVLTAVAKQWIARRDERILMQAPAHELQDIGLHRADVRRAVRTGRVEPR